MNTLHSQRMARLCHVVVSVTLGFSQSETYHKLCDDIIIMMLKRKRKEDDDDDYAGDNAVVDDDDDDDDEEEEEEEEELEEGIASVFNSTLHMTFCTHLINVILFYGVVEDGVQVVKEVDDLDRTAN